jgi:hypothetical protein
MENRMRRFRNLLLLLLLAVLAAGHYLYWYAPRERAAAPEAGGLPARLLGSGAYDACFWAPYPHQNLAQLQGAINNGAAWVAAVARVADVPAPVVPAFGPFTVPPASELAGCSDLDGDRFLIVTKVYPSLAAVARLSGRLAENPWLAGGEVTNVRNDGPVPVQRTLTIAWREGYWTVSAGGELPDLAAEDAPSAALPDSLALFRLLRGPSEFPTGTYRLRREAEDLVLALDRDDREGAPEPPRPELPRRVHPVLLAVAGPSWPAAEPKPLPPAAFALFDLDEASRSARISSLGSLPGAAVFNAPGEQRWGLPTQGIAGLVTKGLPKGNAGGWRIIAVDDASLGQAKILAPRLTALTAPEGEDAGGRLGDQGRLILGLWAQPRPAVKIVSEIRKVLEGIPLVAQSQVRKWRDWETLLRPLAVCQGLELTATQSPPSFRLVLQRCGEDARATPAAPGKSS